VKLKLIKQEAVLGAKTKKNKYFDSIYTVINFINFENSEFSIKTKNPVTELKK
jgi:hypothetical protein